MRSPLLLLTRGLPSSGKTSWAVDVSARLPAGQVKLVCTTDLRRVVNGAPFPGPGLTSVDEALIDSVMEDVIRRSVELGRDVIVHDNHLVARRPNRLRALIGWRAETAIVDFSDMSAKRCKEHAALRCEGDGLGGDSIDQAAGLLQTGDKSWNTWNILTPDDAAVKLHTDRPTIALCAPCVEADAQRAARRALAGLPGR